jgi:hypothetical protein
MATAIFTTIGTGSMMGAMHALLGPDHMSALLTLTVNRPPIEAAWLGIRWGLGHSVGLLVVTAFFLILKDSSGMDQQGVLDAFQGGMDWAVGAIMLCLGFWGYHGAWRLRRDSLGAAARRGITGTALEMRGVAALQLVDDSFAQEQGMRVSRDTPPHRQAPPLSGGAGGACGAAGKGSGEDRVKGDHGAAVRVGLSGGVRALDVDVEAGQVMRGLPRAREAGLVGVPGAAAKGLQWGSTEVKWGETAVAEGAGAALGEVEATGAGLGEVEATGGEGAEAEATGGEEEDVWRGQATSEDRAGGWSPSPALGAEPRSDNARLYIDGAGRGTRAPVDPIGRVCVEDRPSGLLAAPAPALPHRHWPCSACGSRRAGHKTAYEAAIALGVGVLHGVGGPGGVLGVLPSLLMPGLASSLAYLLSFCASATVTMGAVAICCGLLSSRSAEACRSPRLPWILAAAAATLSVAVGILWIVGCATGRLQEMIHSLGME